MRISRRNDHPERDRCSEGIQAQEWALALLFSVVPTDRALYGWGPAGSGGALLYRLAEFGLQDEPPF